MPLFYVFLSTTPGPSFPRRGVNYILTHPPVCICLEGIADGKVEGLVALEAVDIEIAGLSGVVRQVEGETPVETDNEETEVVADAKTCAEGLLTEEVAQFEVAW